ncbi:unnamed protein product, partial [Dicrocoelium dendriticum]
RKPSLPWKQEKHGRSIRMADVFRGFAFKINQLIIGFGSALVHTIGYQEGAHNFVGIYARNSMQWIVTQQACAAYSYIYVPLYHTLGKEAMQYIIQQTELQTVMCHSMTEAKFILNEVQSSIKYVILATHPEGIDSESVFGENVRLIYFDEMTTHGRTNPVPMR